MALLTAKTNEGTVRGFAREGAAHTAFLGVPFARPPVGKLRFAPPEKPEPRTTELLCSAFSAACIQQPRPGARQGDFSEDCLYLNVYTPAQSADDRLPVMFWIYGGGFSGGSAGSPEFDGAAICDRGAVLVTVNYRCGPLGFFSLPELEDERGFSGNFGILDQIAALTWVKENIAAFGGDPGRVTVFGQSAGGISARILLVSPKGRSLFQRAVVQSGGGLIEADPVRPKDEFTALCRDSMQAAGLTYRELTESDPFELNERLETAVRERMTGHEVGYFQPSLDGVTLTGVPGALIARGEYGCADIICGTVAGDSWMFSRKVIGELGGNEAYYRAFSFSAGLVWARRAAALGRPIRTFYMDRTQPEGGRPSRMRPHYGAATPHGSDIPYIFGTPGARGNDWTAYDRELSAAMTQYWTNFAARGDPNGPGLPVWDSYTKESPLAMHFGDGGYACGELVHDPQEERLLAWLEEHPGMLTSMEGFGGM